VSASDDAVILRNFEGMLVRYQAEDKPLTVKPTATQGVSALVSGHKSAIVPAGSERLARRRLNVLTQSSTNSGGCCNDNGHSDAPTPMPQE
jgi:lysine 2,3-aminomutase